MTTKHTSRKVVNIERTTTRKGPLIRVNLTISVKDGATQSDVQKAVRRALEGSSTVLEPNTSVKVKGVLVVVKGGNVNDVRQWARQNGIEVGARGRVGADVIAAFEAAHKPAKRNKK